MKTLLFLFLICLCGTASSQVSSSVWAMIKTDTSIGTGTKMAVIEYHCSAFESKAGMALYFSNGSCINLTPVIHATGKAQPETWFIFTALAYMEARGYRLISQSNETESSYAKMIFERKL